MSEPNFAVVAAAHDLAMHKRAIQITFWLFVNGVLISIALYFPSQRSMVAITLPFYMAATGWMISFAIIPSKIKIATYKEVRKMLDETDPDMDSSMSAVMDHFTQGGEEE